jgi:hypothetical protein
MTELKPCPFCGSEELNTWIDCVYCTECGAQGPDADDKDLDLARAAWNGRAQDDQS